MHASCLFRNRQLFIGQLVPVLVFPNNICFNYYIFFIRIRKVILMSAFISLMV